MRIKSKKICSLTTAMLLSLSSVTVSAQLRVPSVSIDDTPYSGEVIMIGDTTYVGLREFSEAISVDGIEWNGDDKTASVTKNGSVANAKIGKNYITSGNKAYKCAEGILLKKNRTLVPLRAISDALGYMAIWNGDEFSVSVVSGEEETNEYTEEDLYWLSRIIHAEAEGECFDGKLAVGAVVMNRVASPDFPNSVYGVIFDTAGGVQFSPVIGGSIYSSPDADSIAAAEICLEGKDGMSDEILFFLNPEKAESGWIPANRTFVTGIGRHDFYA